MGGKRKGKNQLAAIGGGKLTSKVADRPAVDDRNMKVVFSFEYADPQYNGAWWWPKGDEASALLEFMCGLHGSTWADVERHTYNGADGRRRRMHHPQAFDEVCTSAQRRLADLRYDQIFVELFRFRLGTHIRLWGFRQEGVFYVLWWDPKHQVYPLDD